MASSGFFVTLLYPGAFVELRTAQLEVVKPWQRLRIFCGGVWHNVLITAGAAFLLAVSPCTT